MKIKGLVLTIFLAAVMTVFAASSADSISEKERMWADSIENNPYKLDLTHASRLEYYLSQLYKSTPAERMRSYCASALTQYAWFLIQNREWYLAGPFISAAETYCDPSDLKLFHFLQSAKVGVLMPQGNYDECEKILKSASRYYKEQGDTVEWLKCCMNLCRVYLSADNRYRARAYYDTIVSVSKKPGYASYFALSATYGDELETNSQQELALLKEALEVAVKNNFQYLFAAQYNALANYYLRSGDYSAAIVNASKALEYAGKHDSRDEAVKAYGVLGEAYSMQKDYIMAFNSLNGENKELKAISRERSRSIYTDIEAGNRLLKWCERHVVTDASANRSVRSTDSGMRFTVMSVIVVLFIIGILFIIFRKQKKTRLLQTVCGSREEAADSDVHEFTPSVDGECARSADEDLLERNKRLDEALREEELKFADKNAECEAMARKYSSLCHQLNVLDTFYNSVNPMIDRLRSEIKNIGNTGNPGIDSKIRIILAELMQNRFPEMQSDILGEARNELDAFRDRLIKSGFKLTSTDLRIAVYLRLGLTPREISLLDGIQAKSVNQARYRLRKSLGLNQDESLEAFLKAF